MREPATLSNGRTLTYVRGLMLQTNYAGRLVWHGGSAAGYKTVVGRFVDQEVSIAVLCNAGEAADDRTEFAGGILDLFTADKGLTRPPPSPPTAGMSGVDVAGRAGLFFNERTGDPLRLAAGKGTFMVAGGGPLITLAADRFRIARASDFMSNDRFELHFLSNDRFELKSMEGSTTAYRRAQPYAPTADELQAFAGRYESDELRASFEVAAGNDGLMMRLNDAPGAGGPFRPVERDTFQAGMVTMRFVRNDAGRLVAFDFTSPVLRNIRYTRVEGR